MLITLVSLNLGAGTAPATAQMFCMLPSPPYCADTYGAFEDRWDFDSCRSEVELYRSRMRSYLSCLDEERTAAIRKLNIAIDAFNLRASSPR
jgi:hypothetical protein